MLGDDLYADRVPPKPRLGDQKIFENLPNFINNSLDPNRVFWSLTEDKHPRQGAVREGNYKLVRAWKEDPTLYDLSKDIGEQNNLIDEMPEVAARLREAFRAWETEVDGEREAQVLSERRTAPKPVTGRPREIL